MKVDPITGPISAQELKALAVAPFGAAAKAIRKHDPFWGRGEGEKIKWIVKCSRRDEGIAEIMAASQDEADDLADELSCDDVEWDSDDDDFKIVSVEPAT